MEQRCSETNDGAVFHKNECIGPFYQKTCPANSCWSLQILKGNEASWMFLWILESTNATSRVLTDQCWTWLVPCEFWQILGFLNNPDSSRWVLQIIMGYVRSWFVLKDDDSNFKLSSCVMSSYLSQIVTSEKVCCQFFTENLKGISKLT